jgi:hypothetical protein
MLLEYQLIEEELNNNSDDEDEGMGGEVSFLAMARNHSTNLRGTTTSNKQNGLMTQYVQARMARGDNSRTFKKLNTSAMKNASVKLL